MALAFHGNYGPILYHFRDKARYWFKITICCTPCNAFNAFYLNIAIMFGTEKLE